MAWTDPQRQAAFEQWLGGLAPAHGIDPATVRSASADASFRRYFRVDTADGPRIVMDAPPAQEDCSPFVHMAGLLRGAGLNAPEVIAWDEARGFMLLSDLGDRTYLSALDDGNARALYGDALAALVRLQGIAAEGLVPAYDRALLAREMQLFPDWYVARHIGTELSDDEAAKLAACVGLILENNLAQPSVLVHRDYHSRNLMLSGEPGSAANPGILDFQDAVWGPITYDVASVLRDAYVELDEEVQIDYAVRYWERARKAGLPVGEDFGAFWRNFEWMGLQRHLKVLGIFARLSHRDGKDTYLDDLPLVWRYAHRVASRYNGLGPLAHLLERLAGTARIEGFY
ncbi:aminoglycoside phosphotransferase [Rhizobacter sp. Root1221]|nr:aminoglycoside phosphotransferase [Rhizobacter sp. Root1221]